MKQQQAPPCYMSAAALHSKEKLLYFYLYLCLSFIALIYCVYILIKRELRRTQMKRLNSYTTIVYSPPPHRRSSTSPSKCNVSERVLDTLSEKAVDLNTSLSSLNLNSAAND